MEDAAAPVAPIAQGPRRENQPENRRHGEQGPGLQLVDLCHADGVGDPGARQRRRQPVRIGGEPRHLAAGGQEPGQREGRQQQCGREEIGLERGVPGLMRSQKCKPTQTCHQATNSATACWTPLAGSNTKIARIT